MVDDQGAMLEEILHKLPSSTMDASPVRHDPERALTSDPALPPFLVQVQGTPLRQPSGCRSLCSCPCHSMNSFASGQNLRQMLGSLFLGSSSIPYIAGRCTDPACRRDGSSSATVSYIFPSWVCGRRILAAVYFARMTRPQFVFRVRQVVPANADVFIFAANGNIEGLKELFTSRKASPLDTDVVGRTPLHVC